ncbi:MAG: DivIVA domain-containing protein [Ornithinibacter sp.]
MPLLILALVAAALVVVVLGVASGRIRVDPLADAMHSVPDHGLPVIPDAADVDAVRFDTAPLGYDPRDVDAALDRLRDTLEEQEHRIATLREGSVD